VISSLNTAATIRVGSSQKMDGQLLGSPQKKCLNKINCFQDKENISFRRDTLLKNINKAVIVEDKYLDTSEVIENEKSSDQIENVVSKNKAKDEKMTLFKFLKKWVSLLFS